MTRRATTSLAAALTAALLAVAVPTAAHAQSGPTAGAAGVEATVSIDNCQVKRSRNAGGFTYFYCAVSSDTMPGGSGSVKYSVNLPVYTPRSGGTWSKKTGTVQVGAGAQVLNLKFATRRSVLAGPQHPARHPQRRAGPERRRRHRLGGSRDHLTSAVHVHPPRRSIHVRPSRPPSTPRARGPVHRPGREPRDLRGQRPRRRRGQQPADPVARGIQLRAVDRAHRRDADRPELRQPGSEHLRAAVLLEPGADRPTRVRDVEHGRARTVGHADDHGDPRQRPDRVDPAAGLPGQHRAAERRHLRAAGALHLDVCDRARATRA